MPNGLAIMTAEGIKEFPIAPQYSAKKGKICLEQTDCFRIYFRRVSDDSIEIDYGNRFGIPVAFSDNNVVSNLVMHCSLSGLKLTSAIQDRLFGPFRNTEENRRQLEELKVMFQDVFGEKLILA